MVSNSIVISTGNVLNVIKKTGQKPTEEVRLNSRENKNKSISISDVTNLCYK